MRTKKVLLSSTFTPHPPLRGQTTKKCFFAASLTRVADPGGDDPDSVVKQNQAKF